MLRGVHNPNIYKPRKGNKYPIWPKWVKGVKKGVQKGAQKWPKKGSKIEPVSVSNKPVDPKITHFSFLRISLIFACSPSQFFRIASTENHENVKIRKPHRNGKAYFRKSRYFTVPRGSDQKWSGDPLLDAFLDPLKSWIWRHRGLEQSKMTLFWQKGQKVVPKMTPFWPPFWTPWGTPKWPLFDPIFSTSVNSGVHHRGLLKYTYLEGSQKGSKKGPKWLFLALFDPFLTPFWTPFWPNI